MSAPRRRAAWCLALTVAATVGCGSSSSARRPLVLVAPALDGGEVDLRRYRGAPVVLHLFTTWSLGAQSDLGQLSAVHAAGPRGAVTVIGVALDPDGYRLVAPWRKSNQIRYLVAVGGPALAAGRSALGPIRSVPTTVILDRRGVVAHRIERPLAPGELQRLVSALAASR